MGKKVLKLGLSFIVVVMIILNGRYNNRAFAENNYENYIKDIKIIDEQGNVISWFKGYEIKDDKIILKISKDNVKFFWDWEWLENIDNDRLIIETENIEDIMVNNSIFIPENEDWGFDSINGVENFKEKAGEWEKGIEFKELGAYVEGWDYQVSCFSKDAPLKFTFIPIDGVDFTLSWEVVEYKEENPEEDEFKIEISITPQSYDGTAKSGIVKEIDGEETLVSYGEFKIGDKVTIKAIDGDQSGFKKWYSNQYYENPPEGHNPDKYIILEDFIGDITKNELTFTIDKEFKNIKNDGKKCELFIDASFNTFNKIYINTNPENDKLIAEVDKTVVPDGDKFTIEAISKDGNWIFDKWKIDPLITGAHTPNHNADLTDPKLTLTMVDVNIQIPEERFKVYITANFREKGEEPEIESIEPIVMEVYIGDTYELPEEVQAIMTDGSKRMVKVDEWNPEIPYLIDEEMDNYHFGKVQGKIVQLKIKGIKREEEPKCTISFNTSGGNDMSSIKVEEGQKLTKLDDPIREGYKFISWYEDSNLTKEFSFETPITRDITLYAKWEKGDPIKEYAVIFNTNGGSSIHSKKVTAEEKITRPADPIKEGHKFIGWYEDPELTRVFNFNTPITQDITLYAKWEEELIKEYTVTFNTDGGNNINSEKVKQGETVSKPSDPTKEGHKFIGWYEDPELTKAFNFDTPIAKDLSLYAKWEEEPLQEILEIKSVELTKDGQTISKGIIKDKEITLKLPKGFDEIINQGKHMLKITGTEGTRISQDGGYGAPIEEWTAGEVSNSIMPGQSAKFIISKGDNSVEYIIKIEESTVKKYTVIFNTNGGSSINSKKVIAGEKVSRPSDPTKSNYKFVGWYEDSNLTKVFNFNTPITKDITLYTKWEKVEKPEPEKPVEKKDAKILSFKLLGIEGSINHSTGKIYVDLPYRTSLKDLIPVITYSEGATISPDIGMAKDFERTVRYTLSGENFNSKTYEVDVSMPREKEYEEIINRDSNWYRDRHRDSRRSRRDEKDWYEITQEIKKERLREEERKTRAEIRREALDEVSKITAQSENIRRDLSFTQFSDYMDIRLNTIGMNDLYKNKINIPAGVLKNLKELEFDYLKYSTGLLGIKIYPSMDSPDGVYINIKPAPNEPYNNVQAQWSKIKGAGRIFEIETNSTKAGLSIEMRLEKLLPAEYIRVVKYNYMKRQFEDLAPEKWSIIDGYIHMQQVSGGIYGVIYKR
ncbi:InlB B-repeat-containing protein [Tissierella praeacuta]|uniref:InlB B-repeat-containing protein n=1 Tax=Tissierella praeacuta TaxID=43131 RepID=UPI0028B02A4F|nr:InlB B-repeat-containing protein [Tissierella praeacuta]